MEKHQKVTKGKAFPSTTGGSLFGKISRDFSSALPRKSAKTLEGTVGIMWITHGLPPVFRLPQKYLIGRKCIKAWKLYQTLML